MNTEDVSSLLEKFLKDPDSLQKAMSAAQSLLGSEKPEQAPADAEPGAAPLAEPGAEASVAARVLGALGTPVKSDRISLLQALRPLVSPARAEKIDHACKLLKLAEMFSLFSEDILKAL